MEDINIEVNEEIEKERNDNLKKLMTGNHYKDLDKIKTIVNDTDKSMSTKFVSQDEVLKNTNMSKTAALYVLNIFMDYLISNNMIEVKGGRKVYSESVSVFIDNVKAYKDEYSIEYSAILYELKNNKIKTNMFFSQPEQIAAIVQSVINTELQPIMEKITGADRLLEDHGAEQISSLSDKLENYLTGEAEREAERRAREDEFLQKMAEIVEMKTSNEIQEEIEAARADAEEKEEKNKSLEARIAELEKMMAAKEQESKDQATKIKELESKVEEERGEKEKAISDKEAAILEADKLNEEIKQGLTAISEAANTKGFGSGKAVKVAASMETQRLLRLINNQ